jgi:hypothetical protein
MYVDAPAVRDRGLITASGLADVEFAEEIMAELGVLSDSDRAYWTSLFRGGRLQSGLPNKRLKLTGGDRSNGTGMLFPRAGKD